MDEAGLSTEEAGLSANMASDAGSPRVHAGPHVSRGTEGLVPKSSKRQPVRLDAGEAIWAMDRHFRWDCAGVDRGGGVDLLSRPQRQANTRRGIPAATAGCQ